jgi:hypothetical protein
MTEEDDEKRRTLVRNEQLKLTATYLNGVAIALYAVGGLAPLLSAVTSAAGPWPSPTVTGIAIACFIGSGWLHAQARRVLRGLKP